MQNFQNQFHLKETKVSDEIELKLNETDFFGIYFLIQSSRILKSDYKLNKNNLAFVSFSKEICGAPRFQNSSKQSLFLCKTHDKLALSKK